MCDPPTCDHRQVAQMRGERDKAAVKMQSSFRGHKTRKEMAGRSGEDNAPGSVGELIVRSQFSNIAGVYAAVEEHAGFPAYQHQNGKPYVYKLFGQNWAIGDELGSEATYSVVQGSPEESPVEASWDGIVMVLLLPTEVAAVKLQSAMRGHGARRQAS